MTAAGISPVEVAPVRSQFPLLSRCADGRPLVYLDSAATSQKPQRVLDAMDAYYREANANVHRGVYALAAEATDRFEAGRDAAARRMGRRPTGRRSARPDRRSPVTTPVSTPRAVRHHAVQTIAGPAVAVR